MKKLNNRCSNFLYLIASLLLPFSITAQTKKTDSLEALLNIKRGQEYFSILKELGYQYLVDGNYDQAIKRSGQLLSLGQQQNDSLQISRALAIRASVLRRTGFIDSAMRLYNAVYPIVRRNSFEEEFKNVTNSLGLLYVYQGNYDKALQFLLESLSVREKLGIKLDISIALQNIGLVYYKLKDFDKALSIFLRANNLRLQIKNDFSRDALLLNISLCYSNQSNFRSAKQFLDQARSIRQSEDTTIFVCMEHHALGFMLAKQQKFAEAEPQFVSSYKLSKEIADIRFQLDNIIHLSSIYLRRNKLSLAEAYLNEAETLMDNNSKYNLELVGVYTQFSNLYRRTNNYKKIAHYQDKLLALKDSIFNEKMTTNLMRAEADYVARENSLKLRAQNKILELNDEIIFRQNIVNTFIGLVALLLILLAVNLARSNRRKQFANRRLDKKVKERTAQLEVNRDVLERALKERDVMLNKASSDIRSSVATIKGLCLLGLKDIDHPKAPDYFHKLSMASAQLEENLHPLLFNM